MTNSPNNPVLPLAENGLRCQHKAWIYIAPLAVLLLSGGFLPWPEHSPEFVMSAGDQLKTVWLRGIQVTFLAAAVFLWLWKYGRSYSWRISPLAFVMGAVGVVLWLVLARFDVWLVENLGLRWLVPVRDAFNPDHQLTNQTLRTTFLVLRFFILAVLVPFAEEIFLRGWLVRFYESDSDWSSISLQKISRNGFFVITAYAVLAHPMEAIAAVAWFNLVSWWMKRTGSLADCIVIHATTNLLLGVWIVWQNRWELW